MINAEENTVETTVVSPVACPFPNEPMEVVTEENICVIPTTKEIVAEGDPQVVLARLVEVALLAQDVLRGLKEGEFTVKSTVTKEVTGVRADLLAMREGIQVIRGAILDAKKETLEGWKAAAKARALEAKREEFKRLQAELAVEDAQEVPES